MGTLFENRYRMTDQMIKEYARKVLCKRLIWLSALILAISLPMFSLTLLWKDYVMSAVYFICLLIAAVERVVALPLTVRQMKENTERMHGGKEQETVVRFGEKISISEGEFYLAIEYSQIIKIHYLKHSCVLMFGKSNGIMLAYDGFAGASFDEFREFIMERCPLG